MAEVRYTPRAERSLGRLAPEVLRRIEAALRRLAEGQVAGEPLRGRWRGLWRLRVGDWRVIYALAEDDIILVHGIGHRREVYRQR